MKKILFTFTLISGLMLMNSCGEKAKEESKDKEEATEEPAEEPAEETPEVSEIKCDQGMMDFMAMLKGSFKDVEAALAQYGAEGLESADIEMYDLKDAKVVACSKSETGECCTMEAGAGMTIRTYDICWTDGKISSIVDKGMR